MAWTSLARFFLTSSLTFKSCCDFSSLAYLILLILSYYRRLCSSRDTIYCVLLTKNAAFSSTLWNFYNSSFVFDICFSIRFFIPDDYFWDESSSLNLDDDPSFTCSGFWFFWEFSTTLGMLAGDDSSSEMYLCPCTTFLVELCSFLLEDGWMSILAFSGVCYLTAVGYGFSIILSIPFR